MKPGWSVQFFLGSFRACARRVRSVERGARGTSLLRRSVIVPQRVDLAPSRAWDLAPYPALRGGQAAVAYEASKDLAATAAAKATNTAAAAYETSKQYVAGAANVAADKSAQAAQQVRAPGRGAGRCSARRPEGPDPAVPPRRSVHGLQAGRLRVCTLCAHALHCVPHQRCGTGR